MKASKFICTAIAVLALGFSYANETEPGKKINEMDGSVVNAANKKPIKNVVVTAYYTSKKEMVVITDEKGGYAFDDLKPGVYKFVFEKTGYEKIVKENVTIKTDETFNLDIKLIEKAIMDLYPSPLHFMDMK